MGAALLIHSSLVQGCDFPRTAGFQALVIGLDSGVGRG
jgi:hypothetical protein